MMDIRNILLFLTSAWLLSCANQPARIPERQAVVHFIDVGQGDAILLEHASFFILVDGAKEENKDSVIQYLASARVDTLDLVILSHPDEDHYGGLNAVFRYYPVRQFVHNGMEVPSKVTYDRLLTLVRDTLQVPEDTMKAGDRYAFDDLMIECIYPVCIPAGAADSTNTYSLVCRADLGDYSVLLTGDIDSTAEARLVQQAGDNIIADILKVPHHGSRYSSTYVFLQAVDPLYAVISSGNEYGHPHAEVLARLDSLEIATLRTDRSGSIRLKVSAETGITREN